MCYFMYCFRPAAKESSLDYAAVEGMVDIPILAPFDVLKKQVK